MYRLLHEAWRWESRDLGLNRVMILNCTSLPRMAVERKEILVPVYRTRMP